MCFSPQRRAIFRHRNFKKCSETISFLTCSLPNVLFATAACNFSTSELQKVLWDHQSFNIFTSKCASRHSGVQFLISLLSTYLRTRRFNRPTFRLTQRTNHWKNTAFRNFSNIWRGCIFFLLTFALVHLFTSDLTACLICFSTLHIVGSLLFKLPSMSLFTCQFSTSVSGPCFDKSPIHIQFLTHVCATLSCYPQKSGTFTDPTSNHTTNHSSKCLQFRQTVKATIITRHRDIDISACHDQIRRIPTDVARPRKLRIWPQRSSKMLQPKQKLHTKKTSYNKKSVAKWPQISLVLTADPHANRTCNPQIRLWNSHVCSQQPATETLRRCYNFGPFLLLDSIGSSQPNLCITFRIHHVYTYTYIYIYVPSIIIISSFWGHFLQS